jgi:hypothetical protein
MKKQISAAIEISASPERLWELLVGFDQFPLWNPFIRRARGHIRPGERLTLLLKIPNGPKLLLRPKILMVNPGRKLRWVGNLLFPGLFDGDHTFLIEPMHARKTRFIQEEHFTGVLVPLFGGYISRGAARGFTAMNAAMKRVLEGDARSL